MLDTVAQVPQCDMRTSCTATDEALFVYPSQQYAAYIRQPNQTRNIQDAQNMPVSSDPPIQHPDYPARTFVRVS
jgi:hypothetical protein